MLNVSSPHAAGERKEHWETLRTKNVPRFLFRAFNSESGGGSHFAINNPTEIVPRGFMNGQNGHRFYEMSEREIFTMADDHFFGRENITEFSSWAASLHVVLYYAQSMPAEHNVHIAVLDRHQLGGEVLIWHALVLVDVFENEYLAHGCVGGSGYTAVPFEQIIECGLGVIFQELD
ncbi:hypothetical protein Ptr86124_003063 [Pyrenophora tritici-repentis]|uniref:DUF7587 domain-containing protein n=1 Tax=Pyrenophora tritici-repentis TaxID=45151 RepID=A0A922NMK2_9PLEO|nr:hypothetical protein Ptr86124_003063 [Pyrenophora tritici-repentis]